MNRLKELLKPKVTYKDIAEQYGCTISFVGHVAEGRSKPPMRFKKLVSEMLGIPITTIFPEEAENNAN